MRPTPEQILSFIAKVDEIRDIHEVLPSDDPGACDKAIVEVFNERFVSDHWIGADIPPPIVDEERGESREYLACLDGLYFIAVYTSEGVWKDSNKRTEETPTYYRELPDTP